MRARAELRLMRRHSNAATELVETVPTAIADRDHAVIRGVEFMGRPAQARVQAFLPGAAWR